MDLFTSKLIYNYIFALYFTDDGSNIPSIVDLRKVGDYNDRESEKICGASL